MKNREIDGSIMRWRSHNCSVSLLLKSKTKLTNLSDLALYRSTSRNSFPKYCKRTQ